MSAPSSNEGGRAIADLYRTGTLRAKIALAIMRPFEKAYQDKGAIYNPDDVYRAADEVMATLLSEFTGNEWEARFHPTLIGPAQFVEVGADA